MTSDLERAREEGRREVEREHAARGRVKRAAIDKLGPRAADVLAEHIDLTKVTTDGAVDADKITALVDRIAGPETKPKRSRWP